MGNLSLRLPDSLHRKLREIAERDDVSVNQFIATAVAEKAAAFLTVEYLEERGRRVDRNLIDRLLARVPDVEPLPGDELPTAKGKSIKPEVHKLRRTLKRHRGVKNR
jgi:predicted transcriptional regulator